jgi:predicted Ser/Thr protein kinase
MEEYWTGQRRSNYSNDNFGQFIEKAFNFTNGDTFSPSRKRKAYDDWEENPSKKRQKTADISTEGVHSELIRYAKHSITGGRYGSALLEYVNEMATLLPSNCALAPLSYYWFVSPIELKFSNKSVEQKKELHGDYYMYQLFTIHSGFTDFTDLEGNFIARVLWKYDSQDSKGSIFASTMKIDTTETKRSQTSLNRLPEYGSPVSFGSQSQQQGVLSALLKTGQFMDNSESPSIHIPYAELKFGSILGEGGFGTVHLAEWKSKKIAVKQFKQYDGSKEDVFKEVQALKRLSHKHIVALVGVTTNPTNETMLVMEYLENGSLEDLLKRNKRPLTIRDAVQIALDVAEGLHYLHQQKIIHRDLKSANVLLYDNNKRAKLSDFGTARIFDKSSKASSVVGTIGYMAPEVLQELRYNAQADVYSFGVLLYHMLSTKNLPAIVKDSVHLVEKIESDVKDIEFQELIIKCCKLEPESRPTIEYCIGSLKRMRARDDDW